MAFSSPIIAQILRTAATGRRVEIQEYVTGTILGAIIKMFTGDTDEVNPAHILAVTDDLAISTGTTRISSPDFGGAAAELILSSSVLGAPAPRRSASFDSDLFFANDTTLRSLVFGNGGSAKLSGFDAGRVVQNTDAAGSITIPHRLGVLPPQVFWQDESTNNPNLGRYGIGSSDASNIVINFRNTTTNAVTAAATTIRGSWLALAMT